MLIGEERTRYSINGVAHTTNTNIRTIASQAEKERTENNNQPSITRNQPSPVSPLHKSSPSPANQSHRGFVDRDFHRGFAERSRTKSPPRDDQSLPVRGSDSSVASDRVRDAVGLRCPPNIVARGRLRTGVSIGFRPTRSVHRYVACERRITISSVWGPSVVFHVALLRLLFDILTATAIVTAPAQPAGSVSPPPEKEGQESH